MLCTLGEVMKVKLFEIFLMFFPCLAFAGINSFECTVTAVHAVSQEGEIVSDTEHLKKQVGSVFSVERSSGAIRGGYFINNKYSENINVINEPTDNSYYVISINHGPIRMVGYLYIANHRKWPQKPFTYTGSGEYVYSGYCI